MGPPADVRGRVGVVLGAMHGLYLRHERIYWVVAAAVSYALIGMQVKVLLNWVVGPIWPVLFVWFGPPAVRRLTGWKDALP